MSKTRTIAVKVQVALIIIVLVLFTFFLLQNIGTTQMNLSRKKFDRGDL